MKPNLLFCLVITVLLMTAPPIDAQQPGKIPRIGYVSTSGDPKTPGDAVEAFREGLRELGYIEGKNILVEYRYIQGKINQSSELVSDVVQSKVDVLVVGGLTPVLAAKQATKTTPIVMVTTQDPVALGLIASWRGRAAISQG